MELKIKTQFSIDFSYMLVLAVFYLFIVLSFTGALKLRFTLGRMFSECCTFNIKNQKSYVSSKNSMLNLHENKYLR